MKLQLLVFSLFSILIFGCSPNKENDSVFIGGEIINPVSEYFILSRDDKIIDTVFLNQKNQFRQQFKGLKEGIYTFNHPPENQIMYLSPGDSIMLWLNTMDFDQSINFSGRGAEKSSYLLEMFLHNQENNDFILSYYKIPPAEFASITDSIRKHRYNKLNRFIENKEYSEKFLDIAEASIDYEYFHLRERYTFLAEKYYRELAEQIPKGFHNYRDEIDFNNKNLSSYYVYNNFIEDFLRTQAIERCRSQNNPECYNLTNYEGIKYRILLGDSLIEEKKIKNRFLNRLASQGITFAKDSTDIEATLALLDSINYSGNFEDIKTMATIQKRLLPGNNLGELELLNKDLNSIKIKALTQKPAVTYHWSMYSKGHFYWQQNIINRLRERYPEVDFIGINIDNNTKQTWQKIVREDSKDPKYEFQLGEVDVNRELLQAYLHKLFFIDSSGTIVYGGAKLNSPTFEREILEFLNSQE